MEVIEICIGDGTETQFTTPDLRRTKMMRYNQETPVFVGGWMDSGGGVLSFWSDHRITLEEHEKYLQEIEKSLILYDGPEMNGRNITWLTP